MSTRMKRENIIDMATGHRDKRSHLDKDVVQEHKAALYQEVIEKLETIYDLTLLEGALTCDDFHDTKRTFSNVGEEYGYIHSFIERSDKTNVFRFQYRRPTPSGKIVRESIKINRALGGYAPTAFKRAGHDLEKDLCLMTEQDYLPLRKESRAIRLALRKLYKHSSE